MAVDKSNASIDRNEFEVEGRVQSRRVLHINGYLIEQSSEGNCKEIGEQRHCTNSCENKVSGPQRLHYDKLGRQRTVIEVDIVFASSVATLQLFDWLQHTQ